MSCTVPQAMATDKVDSASTSRLSPDDSPHPHRTLAPVPSPLSTCPPSMPCADAVFMDWAPQDRTTLHVVDLRDGSRRSFTAPPCFVFHWANAWESEDGRCAVAAHLACCYVHGSLLLNPWEPCHLATAFAARPLRLPQLLSPQPAVLSLSPSRCSLPPSAARYLHIDACLYDDPQICNDLYLEPLRADYAPGRVPGRAYLRRATIDLQAADGGRGRTLAGGLNEPAARGGVE